MQARLNDLKAQYRAGGIIALRNDLKFQSYAGKPHIFFVRVAGPNNRTLFLSLPDVRGDFNLISLEGQTVTEGLWTRLEARDHKGDLEIVTARLADGFIQQVGKNMEVQVTAFSLVVVPVIFYLQASRQPVAGG